MTLLRSRAFLPVEDHDRFLITASNRMSFINTNMPSIEEWLRENVNLVPEVTITSTMVIETTTDGSSSIFLSGFALISVVLLKFM